ncbi:MAG: LysR family transcriptional regulator [Opitutales bacterium]
MLLRQLRYFIAVAELENVSSAARRLHISQPPLSRQIQQLEDEIGVTLFERTGKSLKLTAAGKTLLEEARLVMRQVDHAVEATRRAAGGLPREIRIGYAPSLTLKVLPNVLRQLRRLKGDMTIHLADSSTRDMIERLQRKELDFALVVYPGEQALGDLNFREIARHPACAILPVGHPASFKKSISIEAIKHEPLIGFTQSEYPEFHRWVTDIFRKTGLTPHLQEEHDSVTSLMAAIEAGHGLSFGVEGFRELGGDRIRVVPLKQPAPPIRLGAAYGRDLAEPVLKGIEDASLK